MLLFDSRKDKKPFGAVKVGEKVTFTLRLLEEKPLAIRLYIREKGQSGADIWDCLFLRKEGRDYIYSCTFSFQKYGIYFYRFEVECKDNRMRFFGRDKFGRAIEGYQPEWQITVSNQDYLPPPRRKDDIIYHIFVDRFCKQGSDTLLVPYGVAKDWKEDVTVIDKDGKYHANDFFGGNLKGIISKLDYLGSLGVTIIYLSPIFTAHSNHRYDTADFSTIDSMVGTEQDLEELIEKAGKKGMQIMLDGVFNHSGSDSVYFNKAGRFAGVGAYQSKDSPYYDWYTFTDYPQKYNCWWGIDCVPTFNKKSESLRKFLFGDNGILPYWTKKGINWRLDVVDELPTDYLDELTNAVKSTNPGAMILGEVWEDASVKESYNTLKPYFTKGEIDGVMNYVFKDAILDYCKGGKADDFAATVMDIVENYPRKSLMSSMTMLGSHDTPRILNILSGVKEDKWSKQEQLAYRLPQNLYEKAVKKEKIALLLEFFLAGIPSIYYGDEVGMQGWKDPINRRPFPWENMDEDLLSYYRKIAELRGEYKDTLDNIGFELGELLVMHRYGEGDCLTPTNSAIITASEYATPNITNDSLKAFSHQGKISPTPHKKEIIVVANTTQTDLEYKANTPLLDLITGEIGERYIIATDTARIFALLQDN